MSAPIVTPNLDKPAEQMTQQELVQAANQARAAQAPAAVPAPDDAAVTTTGTTTVTVAPPALPEGFSEFEVKPDGTVHSKLVSGEVFDGPMVDAFQKLAASKVATNASWREAQEKLKALTPATPAAEVVEQRQQIAADASLTQLPADQFAELYYQKLNDPAEATAIAMARSLGYDNPDEMKQDFIDMKSATEVQRATQVAASFERECPEFPFTQEATDKLYEVMKANDMAETLGNLKMAHAFCIQNKLYQPRTAEDIAASRGGAKPAGVTPPTPPPMVPTQNAAPVSTTNFANMTSDQIEAEYRRLKQQAPQ